MPGTFMAYQNYLWNIRIKGIEDNPAKGIAFTIEYVKDNCITEFMSVSYICIFVLTNMINFSSVLTVFIITFIKNNDDVI